MKAADVMTANVVSIHPNASISEATQSMLLHGISGLPVIGERGELVGIVTEGDLLRRVETGTLRDRSSWTNFFVGPGQLASEYVQSHSRKVRDVMTPNPEVVREDTPIAEIVLTMETKSVKRVPVVAGDKVVGIVSRADLVRALANVTREVEQTSPGDKWIEEHVAHEIKRQPWSTAVTVSVIVRNGTVELWGTILDESVRRAVRVAAENVSGVKRVNDHLVSMRSVARMGYA